MNVNVSAPVRVFALVGALAAVGLAVWLFLLGGLSPAADSAPAKVIKPLHPVNKSAAPVTPTRPKATPQPHPAKKPAPKARAKPKPRVKPVPNPQRLPIALVRALTRHSVVVVSLYDPEGKVDRLSLLEAQAGAQRAGVGFVALNALDRRDSEALTRKLGVLSAPTFLLYRRPGELVMRIDGFADRDLVAQAALSVAPPRPPRPVSD